MIARLGRANRHTVHWTYNIQISVGLLPRNSGKLNLISFNCATHFIGTRPYDPENLPPSQTLNEVWGKIMGNNPWTQTGACHTCRWKKSNKQKASGGGGWENTKIICDYFPMKRQFLNDQICIQEAEYDFVIGQPGRHRNPYLTFRFILGFNYILLEFSISDFSKN